MFNKKLKFKVLASHRSGVVAVLEGPKDVTEHMVHFVCDMLETGRFGVCVFKCQNEPAVKSTSPTTENWLRKLYIYTLNNNTSNEDKHDTNYNNKYTNTYTRKLHNL